MKRVVDVSGIQIPEWEDAIPEGCKHLRFSPIRFHKELFVIENATDEDLAVLTLVGFFVVNEIKTSTDTMDAPGPSSTDYLIETVDGYRIMKMYYGRFS